MAYADMLILNGKVLTVDKNFSIKEAIAVKNGMIIDVGTSDDVKRLAGSQTKVIDLMGKVILPGAHDAHLHAATYGMVLNPSFLNLSYPNIKSLEELKEKLAAKVKSTPPGTWIKGMGWNPAFLEEFGGDATKLITRYDLDDVSPDHPVYLIHYSCHLLVANSKALELSGLNKDTPDMKGMARDPQTGEPTGIFEETFGQYLLTKNAPLPSYEEIKENIKICQAKLNSDGYTSHTDAGLGVGGDYQMGGMWGSRCIDVYQQMSEAGELTCRASLGVFPFFEGVHSYENLLKGLEKTKLPKNNDPNWVRFWLKFWGDGMLENWTTWMWDEQVCGHHGRSSFPGETDEEQYEDFLKTIKYLHKNGWQIGIHGMGDRIVDKTIDAYIAAMEEFPRNNPGHYIIHGELTTLEQAKRCAKYNIGLSVQPTIDALLYSLYDDLKFRWGGKGLTAKDMSAYKTFMDLGINVAGGSDGPIFFPNWRQSVQDAVTRKSSVNGKAYSPENAITVEDGIRMYTINGAIQENMGHMRGSIEIGKLADFQVLGEDILAVNKEEIGQIPVVMTIVDGKIVYSA
ncbi:amidohydrolase [Desulfoscipio gibsoniae]|uniref:Putative TIM-barrel fold metal-dependent hydrolase n=1 Tax=Desulfoscipio gibsoniae DSM 7213 TaxID=767817 RepID=R4KI68_9FIRM|nr:amidohydrolase [Desulfoscipio gibsoniae]AGL02309.1 putative TIM-barrel fold metal-dependent hydrolase [Desulfoscipio gibsoniae DSM 7213]